MALEKIGKFSTSSAYNLIAEANWEPNDKKWETIWDWKGPERIRIFLWSLTRKTLLTNAERRRRHISENDSYPFCGRKETHFHLFWDCCRIRQTWELINPSLPPDFWYATDWNSSLQFNLNSTFLQETHPWPTWFATACWKYWNARNRHVFEGEYCNTREVFHSIQAAAIEISRLNNMQRRMNSALISPSMGTPIWKHPPSNWIRLNVDGAVSSPTRKSSSGGLFRNDEAKWVTGYTTNIGICSVLKSELWAAFFGLKMAWDVASAKSIYK